MFRQAGGKLRPDVDGTIVEIDLSFSSITDDQIAAISAFPDIRELDLTGTDLHDAAMPSLIGLSRLQSLKLKGTKITSEGLSTLSQMTTLIRARRLEHECVGRRTGQRRRVDKAALPVSEQHGSH